MRVITLAGSPRFPSRSSALLEYAREKLNGQDVEVFHWNLHNFAPEDLIYARFTTRGQALTDALTVFCLMFYLGVMLWGAFDSTVYAFEMNEVNPTAWRPPLWPIKSIITFSFLLMLLQAGVHLIRDIATIRGVKI